MRCTGARALPKRKAIRHGAGVLSEAFRSLPQLLLRGVRRQRLNNLPGPGSGSSNADAPHYALLDRISPLPTTGKIAAAEPPDDNLRVERARLLCNGGLSDLAVRELQAAASQVDGTWAPPEIARVYQDGGRYDRGIEVMKRSTPNYFAVDFRPPAALLGSAVS